MDLLCFIFMTGCILDSRNEGGDRWNSLWRLTVYLRCQPFGVDRQGVKHPHLMGRKRRALNWYQRNNATLKQMREKDACVRDRLRAGRLQRWIQQGQRLRNSFEIPLAQPEVLE